MEQITSRKNRIIRHFRRLASDEGYRLEKEEYVCGGLKLLDEALRWNAEIRCVLWAGQPLRELPETAEQFAVPGDLLDYASPLEHNPRVLFTAAMPHWPRSEPGSCLVLENIQDPGNLGTILRTANAFGLDTVVLTGSCAGLYNPKTVRAAMGALFRQRVWRMERNELAVCLREHGICLYGAALTEKAMDIREAVLDKNCAVAVGSEGQGLSRELLGMCGGELIIPMNPACESLNAAIAAAVILWEWRRAHV